MDFSRSDPKTAITIHCKPNAKKDRIQAVDRDTPAATVAIHAPARDGKANKYLIGFLSKKIGTAKSAISIVRGATSRHKRLEIHGVTTAHVLDALQRHMDE